MPVLFFAGARGEALKETWAEAAAAVCRRKRDFFIEAVRERTRTRREAVSEQDIREELREMGELKDPVQEALRRMLAEFHDEHYHTCPAYADDDAQCECFAGALVTQCLAVLRSVVERGGKL